MPNRTGRDPQIIRGDYSGGSTWIDHRSLELPERLADFNVIGNDYDELKPASNF